MSLKASSSPWRIKNWMLLSLMHIPFRLASNHLVWRTIPRSREGIALYWIRAADIGFLYRSLRTKAQHECLRIWSRQMDRNHAGHDQSGHYSACYSVYISVQPSLFCSLFQLFWMLKFGIWELSTSMRYIICLTMSWPNWVLQADTSVDAHDMNGYIDWII